MNPIDGWIVIIIMSSLMAVAWYTKRFARNATSFLAAERVAGRYMLSVADFMAATGAAWMLGVTQMYTKSGLGAGWWEFAMGLTGFIIAFSGWVVYRFRETRALTTAQFFEMRYSRKFRIFMGMLGWFAGVIHWGIFPIVTARLLTHLMALPNEFVFAGMTLSTPHTIMFALLFVAVFLACSSGQIAVMVTDFLQGAMTNIVLLIVIFIILYKIGWSEIIAGLRVPQGEGMSMLDPMKIGSGSDFGIGYYLLTALLLFIRFKAWPGASGYNAAPRSPHEAKMARIIASWRGIVLWVCLLFLGVSLYAIANNPKFADMHLAVQNTLSSIEDPGIHKLMGVPALLQQILPVGMIGLLAATFTALAVSTDDTNLHSWGSILVQDVYMQFRKKPLTPEQHVRAFRIAIVFSTCSAYFYAFFFDLQDYLLMFMAVTSAIYVGGAGVVLVGGLYWKRGNTTGAWTAAISGSVLAVSGILLQSYFWPEILPGLKEAYANITWLQNLPEKFPVNGTMMAVYSAGIAVASYVIVSMLTKDPQINMDELLHRGEFAVEGDHAKGAKPATGFKALFDWSGGDFTKGDRRIAQVTAFWVLFWVVIGVIGTPIIMTRDISEDFWVGFWTFKIFLSLGIGVIVTVWFTIGGFRDLAQMFRDLKSAHSSDLDDGRVAGHHNHADEEK